MIVSMRGDQLSSRLRSDESGAPKVVLRAMLAAAHRGRAFIISKSPVDRGLLRNAWKVIRISALDAVHLENDQPYAGILERGSRPFKISKEGLEALTGWVKRKILGGNYLRSKQGTSTKNLGWKEARAEQMRMRRAGRAYRMTANWALDDEAKSIAYAIARKWERYGREGKFFIKNALPRMAEIMDEEINRILEKFFNRGLGK